MDPIWDPMVENYERIHAFVNLTPMEPSVEKSTLVLHSIYGPSVAVMLEKNEHKLLRAFLNLASDEHSVHSAEFDQGVGQ